jgi:hypothetical protein
MLFAIKIVIHLFSYILSIVDDLVAADYFLMHIMIITFISPLNASNIENYIIL